MPCAGFPLSLSSSTAYDLLAKACRNGEADGFFFLVQSGANPLDRIPFNPESEALTPEGWCVEQRHFRRISSGYAGIFRGDGMDRMQQYEEDSLLTLLVSSRTPSLSIASFLIDQGEDIHHIGGCGRPALLEWLDSDYRGSKEWQACGMLLLDALSTYSGHEPYIARYLRSYSYSEPVKAIRTHWEARCAQKKLDQSTPATQTSARRRSRL